MKVLHIITGISRSSGGPSRSSQGLVSAECRAGVDAWIYPFDGAEPWIEGVRKYQPKGAELSAADLAQFDIVHIHGIWSPRLHNVAKMCRAAKVPYIIAPRGMLEPWSLKQKWLKKHIARFLYQDKDLKCAASLHATAESEAEQFRKLGFRNPVVISPNGVNLPKVGAVSSQRLAVSEGESLELGVRGQERRVLFVSRMHPKKGVLELVEAWGRLGVRGQELWISKGVRGQELGVRDWVVELVYTLNGEFEREYEAKVKSRILELGMSYQDTDGSVHRNSSTPSLPHSSTSPNFIFTGPLNDDAKWDAYDRADLFVLPTYSENFGIVVAEALWAGVPVITTKGTPWSELEEYKCGKWIDLPAEGSNPLTWEALDEALGSVMLMSDAERGEMGKRGRKLVEEKYTWDAVCGKMVEGYEEIII